MVRPFNVAQKIPRTLRHQHKIKGPDYPRICLARFSPFIENMQHSIGATIDFDRLKFSFVVQVSLPIVKTVTNVLCFGQPLLYRRM